MKVIIDDRVIDVKPGTSVMQAAEELGIQIPHFCYHDHLPAAGCCRMCMVEIEKMPKPVPSCMQPCAEGMIVHTDTPAVRAARKGVMALTLANHPLDCPVCDQGGECDLQEQAMLYGADHSSFHENKRIVSDDDFGPLIKTDMTRCILCTRCVRFMNEIAGTPELGIMKRGDASQVVNLNSSPLTSELSGNIIDLCPVGALTSKPNAYRGRPWEYQHTDSIDVMDAVGSAIRIDSREGEVMRIVARQNDAVNDIWISDKARFSYDGLKRQRLATPYIRKDGKLTPATWDEALTLIARRLRHTAPDRVAVLAGDMVDCETMFAMKSLLALIDTPHMDCRQDGAIYDASNRASYIMNTTIRGIEKADAILLIATNPRLDAPVINARIRKGWLRNKTSIAMIGPNVDLSYPCVHLGDGTDLLRKMADGIDPFASVLKNAQHPMLVLGASSLARDDGAALLNRAKQIAENNNLIRDDWNGFNVLQSAASRVGGLDLEFLPRAYGLSTQGILSSHRIGQMEFVYLLGVDELEWQPSNNSFIVYQGHHGDKGASVADVVLPGAAYTEKEVLYVNTEGRPNYTRAAVPPVGKALPDWRIILDVAMACGHPLPYESLDDLRRAMFDSYPHLEQIGQVVPTPLLQSERTGVVKTNPLLPLSTNYYMTDPISRASTTMAACVDEIWSLVEAEVWIE